MSVVLQLVSWGVRQTVGDVGDESAGQIIRAVWEHFSDSSRSLPRALGRANEQTWKAVAFALAGDGWLDRLARPLASGADRGFREQVRPFLETVAADHGALPADFRKACLNELKQARRAGALSAGGLSADEIARRAAGFQRYVDPTALASSARDAMLSVADALEGSYPTLAKLLRRPTPAGPPLAAAAFVHFFRCEIESDPALAGALNYESLRKLTADQSAAFAGLGAAMDSIGDRFDELADVMIDVRDRLGGVEEGVAEANRGIGRLFERIDQLSERHHLRADRANRPLAVTINTEPERELVRRVLADFRALPADHQSAEQLSQLGDLLRAAGFFGEAERSYNQAAEKTDDTSSKAAEYHKAYLAALEQGRFDDALEAIQRVGELDGGRYALFPLRRYRPERILGAGGFGAAFLCHDARLDAAVVVKSLHAADLERDVDQVFTEARVLRGLHHPAIIGGFDCDYAGVDSAGRDVRPYIVMEYFPGASLAAHVAAQGVLTPVDLLMVARQIAEGMKAAHARGVLHRDLKPDNILIRRDDSAGRFEARVIDFGLALRRDEQTAGGSDRSIIGSSVAGTLKYAPPEQRGESPKVAVSEHSDVYAFGKTCCFALFGTSAPVDRQWDAAPEFRKLLNECTDEDVKHRCKNFDAVLEQLRAIELVHKAKAAKQTQAKKVEPANPIKPRPLAAAASKKPSDGSFAGLAATVLLGLAIYGGLSKYFGKKQAVTPSPILNPIGRLGTDGKIGKLNIGGILDPTTNKSGLNRTGGFTALTGNSPTPFTDALKQYHPPTTLPAFGWDHPIPGFTDRNRAASPWSLSNLSATTQPTLKSQDDAAVKETIRLFQLGKYAAPTSTRSN